MSFPRMFGVTKVIAVALLTISITYVSPAWAENPDLGVKVMTRNMYPGADLAVLATVKSESELQAAVAGVIQKVVQSRIPDRAALLAAEIAASEPDLVALQEATRWEIQTADGLLVLDQLDLLLTSLEAMGLHYKVAVVQPLTEVEIPGAATYADHDAILMRSDLPPGHMMTLGSEKHTYEALMTFPVLGDVITVYRGWIAIDVKIRGARFKFANTHLEAPLAGVPETQALQFVQATELVQGLTETTLPIILAGDFNSDAEPTKLYPPDATDSYDLIVASGYADAWHTLFPDDHGYTWPLLSEAGEPATPIERIDLIFSKGPIPLSIARTGTDPVGGLFASDHVGVVASFELSNYRPDISRGNYRRTTKSEGKSARRH